MAEAQLSWQTVASGVSIVGLLAFAQYSVFQTQFAGIEKTVEANRVQGEEVKSALDDYLAIKHFDEYRDGVKERLEDFRRRLVIAEAALAKAAREPVEAETFKAESRATTDKINSLTNTINDINKQLAAEVFESRARKYMAPPP